MFVNILCMVTRSLVANMVGQISALIGTILFVTFEQFYHRGIALKTTVHCI
jgi:hypothetical protein